MATSRVLPPVTEGSRRRITVRINLGETIDLGAMGLGSIKFYMRPLDFSTAKINGASASAITDVSAEVSGAPNKSVWDIHYDPTSADVDTPGSYLINIVITYAGGVTQIYPDGEYIRLDIWRALG